MADKAASRYPTDAGVALQKTSTTRGNKPFAASVRTAIEPMRLHTFNLEPSMNRLVYLSPIVIALGVVACQKREADMPAPSAPAATTTPAPPMAASEPMAPAMPASK